MKVETVLSHVLTVVILVLVVSLSLGYFLGQPVLLSYAESGSMEPAIDEGDGFVLIPSQISGSPNAGDIVTFQAEQVQGGKLTTHRVMGETETGYITKGDDNPFTDQDSGEPPVTDAQIVGEVVTVGGSPVTVPMLGTFVESTRGMVGSVQRFIASSFGMSAVMGTQGLAYLLFGVGVVLFFLSTIFGGGDRYGRKKSRDKERDELFSTFTVVLVAAFFIMLVLTATMLTQGGTTKYELISAESDSPTPRVVPAGDSVDRRYIATNPGHIPVMSFIEPGSPGVEVGEKSHEHYIRANQSVNATVTFTAPKEIGYYSMYVVENRYFAVLPPPVIRELYKIHPWVPLAVINGLIAGAFVVFSAVLVGTKPVRTRTRKRESWIGSKKKDRN